MPLKKANIAIKEGGENFPSRKRKEIPFYF